MPITFKKAGQEAVTLDNISFKGVALDKVTFKKAGQEAVTVFEKAASTKTLAAGTYKWKDAPTLQLFNETIAFASGGSNWTDLTVNPNKGGQILYIGTQGEHIAYGALGWGDEIDKTITLATDQQVSADFYEWAITGGNLQAVLVVPMSFSIVSGYSDTLAYLNTNSTVPTAENYEYKIVGNSDGVVLTNKEGTVLPSLNLPFYCTLEGGVWKCVGKLQALQTSGGLEQRYRVIGTDGTDEFYDAVLGGGAYQYSFTTSDPFAYSFNISTFVEYND